MIIMSGVLLPCFCLMVCFLPCSIAQYTASCSSSEHYHLRLYNTNTTIVEDGTVQLCYSGTWYSVCDYSWDCREANVACRQLGYDKARSSTTDSEETYGNWNHIRNYYYYCSGNENSLTSCSSYYINSYYCSTYDQAGANCIKVSTSSCSHSGRLRLTGGSTVDEGVLEYCYFGKWTPFCNLDVEEAAVACKQLGYSEYTGFLSPDEYTWNFPTYYTGSMLDHISCSSVATESSFSQCSFHSKSYTSCGVSCEHPKAIKCHQTNECEDGTIKLRDGSLTQEGRVEVCFNGVWGSICDNGWTKQAAFVLCKQLGYIYSEPVIYTHSKYGDGKVPIVYDNVDCEGWDKSLSGCSKTSYLHFTCSSTAGVLCTDDCTNGDIRLVGGETLSEGTIEICIDSLWGLITDAGWDEADAKVICRELNLPFDGAQPMYDSHYGKPDRTIHYSYVLCNGEESSVTSCKSITHTLAEGRQIFQEATVAGVVCRHAPPTSKPPVCLPISEETGQEDECSDGELRVDKQSGMLEYCVGGVWSILCHMTHNETTVACRQLGYTNFTWGLPYDIESTVSSSPDVSLISNVSCNSTEDRLSQCIINKQEHCMKYCDSLLGLNCYEPGECSEGSVRLTGGVIEQEGRVEVCVNGVWGSVCDNGWDTIDALVVCQQLGYSNLKPLIFGGDNFGSSSGPLVYSDVQCGGWENSIEECRKKSHLEVQCSYNTVAGVMCSDDCSDGDVRLVGSGFEYEGTVEVCYDNLWGLIDEDSWGLADATVICHQLGFRRTKNATIGSAFGKPNKVIHISSVECEGSETNITQCSVSRYSLKEGRDMLPGADVAGVVCYSSVASSPQNIQSMMIALIGLVSFLIVLIVAITVICCVKICVKKVKTQQKHLPVVTMSTLVVHDNQYGSIESSDEDGGSDTEELMKKVPADKAKSLVKGEEMDITFRPSDEDEPIYEECSTL